jgi:hypothetical protein
MIEKRSRPANKSLNERGFAAELWQSEKTTSFVVELKALSKLVL